MLTRWLVKGYSVLIVLTLIFADYSETGNTKHDPALTPMVVFMFVLFFWGLGLIVVDFASFLNGNKKKNG